MGKPSLAILPTGLPVGAVLTESCHNNQDFNVDSVVSIWTIYHVTTRRALANIGTFLTNFNGRRPDWQWSYIRSWWRRSSGRVIDADFIVYFSSLPVLAVILTIWRKRVPCQRRLEAKRSATLAQPSPILASSVAIRSLVTIDTIQPTQRTEQTIVTIGGASTGLLHQLPRHLAFNFWSRLVVSTPTKNAARLLHQQTSDASAEYTFGIGGASAPVNHRLARRLLSGPPSSLLGSTPTNLTSFIHQQVLGAPTAYTGAVTVFEELRSGQEQVPGAPTASREIASVLEAQPKGSNSRRIVVITLLVLPGGFVIIHYSAFGDLAFWTVTIVLNPGARSSSAVPRRVDNIYRVVPRRTLTLPTRSLIEAGSPQSNVLSICSSIPRRLFRSNTIGLPRALLPPRIGRGGKPLPSHERVAPPTISPKRRPGSASSFFASIHSVEGVLVMACCSTGNGLHWSIQFYPFQHYHISSQTGKDNDEGESIQVTASGIEPKVQVGLVPSVDSDDGDEGDEAEEETEGNDLVEPALVPLPLSRPASPEAEEIEDLTEEELLQADLFPLADSRLHSPECHASDRSTRKSDLYQYVTALSHHYLNLRAMLVRPLLPGEARAIRVELRPRLGRLGERARERRGLPPSTSVATELEGQVSEQEVVEQVNEERVVEQVVEQVYEGVDGQVNDKEVDGQVHDGEAEISRKRKKPRRGGKKPRTKKYKRQTGKEKEVDPTRED